MAYNRERDSPNNWRPTFKERCWAAVALGLVIFVKDWSGYDKWEPRLFSPRPIREVWWHLPVAVAFAFGFIQMACLLAWTTERPWPYWVASGVVLIVIGLLCVWLVGLMA